MSGEIRAVLTDIEGTTSSIAFVTDTLFPYARERLAAFVIANEHELAPILSVVPGSDPVETLLRWSDEDVKATPLKAIQGMIWAEGYADGSLIGHVYPDAADALRRWYASGLRLYVYSSGSVTAQKLIFGHSNAGDLTPLFSNYFDTNTGSKREAESYRAIAEEIGEPAGAILFLSDNLQEIEAARAAGMQALHIDRETASGDIASFAGIEL